MNKGFTQHYQLKENQVWCPKGTSLSKGTQWDQPVLQTQRQVLSSLRWKGAEQIRKSLKGGSISRPTMVMFVMNKKIIYLSVCFFSGLSSSIFVVTQTPGVVVAEGATAHITCCWTGEFKKTRVNWLKKSHRNECELKHSVSRISAKGTM